jgi:glycosyltransferase involved in cell wall biosynthesis
MKVLYVSHCASLYGANKSLLDMIDGLAKFNVKCEVVCPKGELTLELDKRNVHYYLVSYHNEVYAEDGKYILAKGIVKTILNMCIIVRLYYLFFSKKYDIIHTNSSVTFLGFFLAKLLRIPHVWHIREFGYADYKLRYYGGERLFTYFAKHSFNIAISRSIFKRLNLISSTHKTVIHDGIIHEIDICLTSPVIIPPTTFAIVGLLSESKGQHEAIVAFSEYNKINQNSKLLVVGTGAYQQKLENMVHDLHLNEKVIFTGYIYNVTDYLVDKHVTALLMCSRHEALGRVTVEALSKGIPVIGYNDGGTKEIIKHGKNGFLYNSTEELVNHMLSMDNKIYSELANNAVGSAVEYSIENFSKAMYSVYTDINQKYK